MQIDESHKLPCDFIIGHIRFRKGVALETVRRAAERWHRLACEAAAPNKEHLAELDRLVMGITVENKHPPVEP